MREKAEMQKELDRLMEENESLRRVVMEEQEEIASLKVWLIQHLRHNGHV